MSNIHIKSLNIERFRGINNLSLTGFSGINIFTGDNNSGKTSVLEILKTSGNPHSPIVWSNLGRVERNSISTRTVFESIKDLYPVSSEDLTISYSKEDTLNGYATIKLQGTISTQKTIMHEYCKEAHIECEQGKEYAEAEMVLLHTDFFYNGKFSEAFDVYNVTRFDGFVENVEKPYQKYKVYYISPTEYHNECPVITEIFTDNENHKELVNILQLFDDDILDIAPSVRDYSIPFPFQFHSSLKSICYIALDLLGCIIHSSSGDFPTL